jgi:uncharacterized membrane protein YdjX (TVP38/TMEM64 family)
MNDENAGGPPAARSPLRRFLPLGVLIGGLAAFFVLGLQHQLSLETLKTHRATLEGWVAVHPLLSALAFAGLYALIVACSVPGAAPMTLAGGFLFGVWEGGSLVVIAATVGATVIFLATRTALADLIRARIGARIRAMEDGFREGAFSYLLVLRLVPIFPFFLVNLAAGLLGVRLRTYVLATLIGIIPGTFVYAGLGNGLGEIFDAGGTPDLGLIFKPAILIPLIGLALLSLLPVVWRARRGTKAGGA